jgi:pimeloyl-ACP methyl ester carboxylesterase
MPTLVFLPGTLCDARVWQPVADCLDTLWPKHFVDYADSDRITAMAQVALAETRGQIIPIGLSMGGMVALEMWQQAPDRIAALALFDTNPGGDIESRRLARDHQLEEAQAMGEIGLRTLMLTHLIPSYFAGRALRGGASPQIPTELAEVVLAMASDGGLDVLARQSAALSDRRDFWPLLSMIDKPTLIACGAHDQLCPPEQHRRMASLITGSTLVVVEAAGHLAPLEAPDATAVALQSLITSIGGRIQMKVPRDAYV